MVIHECSNFRVVTNVCVDTFNNKKVIENNFAIEKRIGRHKFCLTRHKLVSEGYILPDMTQFLLNLKDINLALKKHKVMP